MIRLYTFERADGSGVNRSTTDLAEATAYAREHGFRLIVQTYELADSEIVEDCTTQGGTPQARRGAA